MMLTPCARLQKVVLMMMAEGFEMCVAECARCHAAAIIGLRPHHFKQAMANYYAFPCPNKTCSNVAHVTRIEIVDVMHAFDTVVGGPNCGRLVRRQNGDIFIGILDDAELSEIKSFCPVYDPNVVQISHTYAEAESGYRQMMTEGDDAGPH